MNNIYVGIMDKLLVDWIQDKEYITATDEGSAIGIAGGYWLAKGERATAFMSADGFMNALNPITSWVIPEKIEMNIVVSVGRMEPSHYVATEMLPPLLELLNNYEGFSERVHIELVQGK